MPKTDLEELVIEPMVSKIKTSLKTLEEMFLYFKMDMLNSSCLNRKFEYQFVLTIKNKKFLLNIAIDDEGQETNIINEETKEYIFNFKQMFLKQEYTNITEIVGVIFDEIYYLLKLKGEENE